MIARLCKGREIADAILRQGREDKVRQFHVKSEIQTLRIGSDVFFRSLSATYFPESAMASTREWRDCLKFSCALLDSTVR